MSPLSYSHHFEPGTNTAAPPVLLLHGTGGDETSLLAIGRQFSPGSALLSPRGDVLENGAPRFFRRIAEGVFDLAEVEQRTHALADFILAAAARYDLATTRLVALGFSNGANIAASLLLLRPEVLAHAVLLRPMVVLQPDETPALDGRQVLISAGQFDPLMPADHPEKLAALLRRGGAEVKVCVHAASHQLVPADHEVARSFFAQLNSR